LSYASLGMSAANYTGPIGASKPETGFGHAALGEIGSQLPQFGIRGQRCDSVSQRRRISKRIAAADEATFRDETRPYMGIRRG